jgi:hypothetical protein
MSGVINRMVQRTRGTLPGIEPLLRSRQTAAAALGTPTEETFASAPPSHSLGPITRQSPSPLPSSREIRVNDGSHVVSDSRETVNEGQPHADNDTVLSRHEPASGEGLHSNTRPPAQAPEPSQPGSPNVLEVQAVTSIPIEAIGEPAAPRLSNSQSALDRPDQRKTEIAPMKQESGSARPRLPESPAVSPLETATEHTEIHITIGSIELRTPRTEVPRAVAPFKPRVTLDDFLRGKSGASS